MDRQHGGVLEKCDGSIRNNTITGNTADAEGGGLFDCNGTVVNCIIWGDNAPSGAQLDPVSTWPTYSCIQGRRPLARGISTLTHGSLTLTGPTTPPETYEDNNYRLEAISACIDKGTNLPWVWIAHDLDGFVRVVYGNASATVDMGAYEYRSWDFKVTQVRKSGGQVQVTWTSRPGDTYGVRWCTDLVTGPWVIEPAVFSQGQSTTWTDLDAASTRRFYRIEADWSS